VAAWDLASREATTISDVDDIEGVDYLDGFRALTEQDSDKVRW
jgi:hypothetical protein